MVRGLWSSSNIFPIHIFPVVHYSKLGFTNTPFMKPVYLSLLLLISFTAISQVNTFEYCQIAAENGSDEDPVVEKFLFGYKHQQYADSLLNAFRKEYDLKRRQLYVTDAMNFLGKLGWELHTVYSISPSRSSTTHYYYVMKRK